MQTRTTTTAKRKPAAPSSSTGKNTARGKLHLSRSNGHLHAQQGTDVAADRNGGAPAVSFSLAGRTSCFVDLVTLPAGVAVLDSRDKYLKATADLFPLASVIKDFKDNDRWSDRTPPEEVFQSMYSKLLRAFPAADGIKLVLKDGVYRLSMKEPVYFNESYPYIPVYWLPVMEKASRDLFNLCMYLVCLVRDMGINDWEDDNDSFMYDEVVQGLAYRKTERSGSGDDDEEIADLEQCFKVYGKNGEATKFLKRLQRGGSRRKWLKEYQRFIDTRRTKSVINTPLMKDIMQWLEIGKQLVGLNENINKYISLPDEFSGLEEQYDELPGTPDQFVLFVWSATDWWQSVHMSYLRNIEGNQGAVPYFKNIILQDKEDMKPSGKSFPELMLQFFYAGRKLEEKHRRAFTSQEALSKALYKPSNLIDIL